MSKKLIVGIVLILIIVVAGVFYFIPSQGETVVRSKITNTSKSNLINGPSGTSILIPPSTVPSGATVTVQQLDPATAPDLPEWANAAASLYDFNIDQPINGSVTIRLPLLDRELNVLGHYKNGYWEIMPFEVEDNFAVVEMEELSLFSWLDFKVSWLADKIEDFLTLRWAENKTLPSSDPSICVDVSNTLGLVAGSGQFIAENELRIFVKNIAPLHLDIYPVGGAVVEMKRTSIFVSVESEYGMVMAPGDIGEWIVELRPGENITFEAYFSNIAVAALFVDLIPSGRLTRALIESALFARNGREMTWGDLKGLLVIPAIAEAVKKMEEIQEMPIVLTGKGALVVNLALDSAPETGFVMIYLLDSEKQMENYPKTVVLGENSTFSLWVGVENQNGTTKVFSVLVKLDDGKAPINPSTSEPIQRFERTLLNGELWEFQVTINIDQLGSHRLIFELWSFDKVENVFEYSGRGVHISFEAIQA